MGTLQFAIEFLRGIRMGSLQLAIEILRGSNGIIAICYLNFRRVPAEYFIGFRRVPGQFLSPPFFSTPALLLQGMSAATLRL